MDENELIDRIIRNDDVAFEELYNTYKQPLANFLYRLCFDKQHVEDIMQETFVKTWKAMSSFKRESKLSTFIFTIAINVWKNEGRKKREKVTDAFEAGTTQNDPFDALVKDENIQRLKAAIEALPEHERMVLVLSEYNDMNYAQISEVLNIPVGTVKSRVFKAMQRLREMLKGMKH